MQPIAIADLAFQPFTTFEPGGALLVAGTGPEHANLMTISWGMFGIMWGRPMAMVMVRPVRHTWSFIENAPDFTINWLDGDWSEAIALCGTKSGRDLDKFAATGLTPIAASAVGAPILAQASLALECRVTYRAPLDPAQFVGNVESWYPQRDYHGLFYGDIVAAQGTEAWRR